LGAGMTSLHLLVYPYFTRAGAAQQFASTAPLRKIINSTHAPGEKMPSPPGSFTLAMVQMRCAAEAEVNMAVAEDRVRCAAQAGAQIVCLPELFLSPYFCQHVDLKSFDLAQAIPGPRTERLARLAKDTGTVI